MECEVIYVDDLKVDYEIIQINLEEEERWKIMNNFTMMRYMKIES